MTPCNLAATKARLASRVSGWVTTVHRGIPAIVSHDSMVSVALLGKKLLDGIKQTVMNSCKFSTVQDEAKLQTDVQPCLCSDRISPVEGAVSEPLDNPPS